MFVYGKEMTKKTNLGLRGRNEVSNKNGNYTDHDLKTLKTEIESFFFFSLHGRCYFFLVAVVCMVYSQCHLLEQATTK